ncbi:hypothetical protein [Streptomyces lydicus]|uniref:hypothetical protein n=1 Tax=Streptomyces lydicus TaxID=47763 RepID=UPI00101154EA|nr:hypothetical protein [Streptomyces lydicus]MCZ1007668.1 hypothetical protein [Streptomyces lydicus]
MHDSAETPEVDDRAAAGPMEAPRKDGIRKRVAGATMKAGKGFLKDDRFVAADFVATTVLLKALANRQGTNKDIENFELLPDAGAEDFDPAHTAVADGQPHRPPVLHPVAGSLVKLSPGERAAEENKAKRKEDTGNDLPPGYKCRPPHFRGGPSEGQDPPQAAACALGSAVLAGRSRQCQRRRCRTLAPSLTYGYVA